MLEFRYDTQLLIEGHDLDEDEISDYFGTGLFHLNQEGGFECHIRLMNSRGLIYWLMQHGEKVRVLEPACVKTELIKTLEAALAQYRE